MSPRLVLAPFLVWAMVQLAVPMGQIWKYEDILRTGVPYKFRTAPVDPYDAFRGRYVALNYADTVAPLGRGATLEPDAPAYVKLRKDDAGFAQYSEISSEPPAEGDYVRVEYYYTEPGGPRQTRNGRFRLPFDRFFMDESRAPQAEAAYRKHANRRGQADASAYVVVRIKGGRGVIQDLYIQDKPIREFLDDQASGR